MPSPPRSRFGQRFLAYQLAAWITLLALTIGHPWATVAVLLICAFVTIPAVLLFRWRGWPFYPRAFFRIFVVRGVIYGQLLLPIVAGAALLGVMAGVFVWYPPLTAGRWAAGGALTIAALTLLAGYIGSRTLAVREIEARVESLPEALDGLRIVQISDLHVGPQTPRGFLARVRRAVESLRPDLIAATGDLIDDRHEDVAHYAAAFASLSAPLGVFAVAGNHDVYAGWEDVERELRIRTGMTVLVNESRVIEWKGERLTVAGVGDPAGRGRRPGGGMSRVAPDVPRALAAAPAGVPVLALAHNPALWPELAARGVALTLSGHTHWGQFALPGFGWSLVTPFLEHAMGAYREGSSLLYVHPGTGYWGIPFRIGARPAVTAIVLRRASETSIVE